MVMAGSIGEDFGVLPVPVERQREPFLKPHSEAFFHGNAEALLRKLEARR